MVRLALGPDGPCWTDRASGGAPRPAKRRFVRFREAFEDAAAGRRFGRAVAGASGASRPEERASSREREKIGTAVPSTAVPRTSPRRIRSARRISFGTGYDVPRARRLVVAAEISCLPAAPWSGSPSGVYGVRGGHPAERDSRSPAIGRWRHAWCLDGGRAPGPVTRRRPSHRSCRPADRRFSVFGCRSSGISRCPPVARQS